ncbi:outer membrane beta-barrel protein [Runella sp. MFBS21]|uniref:outer membrane beta-barrel protein n=1 Tax=Runella sp. MFBS21 TaxID=3034018 RepID=UPI0023F996F5|nr:outer membrane beta-barrel protein [Runella sp. MFBS21]MDF7818920.1 outer membrane beta-barrel protein [Runella sp. MFBS21]
MDTAEENNFEYNWRKAFEEAEEAPPASVWAKIEERLDEDEERALIVPFWKSAQNMRWLAAASVVLIMISVRVGWLNQTTSSPNDIAQSGAKSKIVEKDNKISAPDGQASVAQIPQTSIIAREEAATSLKLSKKQDLALSPQKSQKTLRTNSQNVSSDIDSQNEKLSPTLETTTIAIASKVEARTSNGVSHSNVENTSAEVVAAATNQDIISISRSINSLSIKNLQDLLGLTERQPWVAYQEVPSESANKKKSLPKEYWASVGVMPASYNAGVSIGGNVPSRAFNASGQYALANVTNRSTTSTNRSSLSYALQWQGGLQLNQRWSLETGLNYLQGNSRFEGTSGFDAFSNSYVNNLEAAVNYSTNNSKNVASDFPGLITDKSQIQTLATTQSISNSYQYLQVPVQAGYAIIKAKSKLSLWVLGGVVNNIFLRNSFETGQERVVTVSGADNPYRTLSLSASTGLRVQYRMNKHWTTLVSGNYQQSLGSTTRASAVFEAKPQLFGLGAGLRYGF